MQNMQNSVAVSRFSREELSFPCASLLLFAAHSSQFTNMTLATLISILVQGVGDILLHNGVSEEIIERSREQLETLAQGFVSQLNRLEKEISDQREANQQLQVRVAELEKKVKQCVLSDKRRDVAATRNAVIVRSDKQKTERKVRKSRDRKPIFSLGCRLPPSTQIRLFRSTTTALSLLPHT